MKRLIYMRLNDLKKLVSIIEKNVDEDNTNPEIDFWEAVSGMLNSYVIDMDDFENFPKDHVTPTKHNFSIPLKISDSPVK